MKPTTCHPWPKPLAILMVIVLIVMLLIPAELTDEQLAQIKPGMTLHEAKRLLGEPIEDKAILSSFSYGKPANHVQGWFGVGEMWKPSLFAQIPDEAVKAFSEYESCTWISRSAEVRLRSPDQSVTLKS